MSKQLDAFDAQIQAALAEKEPNTRGAALISVLASTLRGHLEAHEEANAKLGRKE